jgi:hypothetical protein
MIGMATHAFLAGPGRNVIEAVQPALGGDPCANIGVATYAPKFRLASADLVTVGAMHGAVQELVLTGERAGRDLGCCGTNKREAH